MPEYDRVDDVVDQFLRHLEEGTTPPSLYGLTDAERAQAEAIFRLVRACRGTQADVPALEDDPVAIELGLVPAPQPTVHIRGAAVKAARLAKTMNIEQLATALSARGQTTAFGDVLDMELAATLEVDRRFATELAAVLGVPLDRIVEERSGAPQTSLDAFLHSQAFVQAVADWAKRRGRPVEEARVEFGSLLGKAAARSGGEPGADVWAGILRSLLTAHEP